RPADIALADQSGEDARDHALSAACRPNHDKYLVQMQFKRRDIEQAVTGRHIRAALAAVEPAQLFEVLGQDDDRGQRLEQVADLVSVGQPGREVPFPVEIDGVFGKVPKHRAHGARFRFNPMPSKPKWTHRTTYQRIRNEIQALEAKAKQTRFRKDIDTRTFAYHVS